jgi:DNA primase
MELGKRSFSEVVLDLAKKYQVAVQTLQPEERQELQRQISVREQLYEILAITARFYEHALRTPDGEAALQYLTRDRGLSVATIQQFQLGYAPAGWETLYGYLVNQKKYPSPLVEQAGLSVPRKTGDGFYDRFRSRLMIPIHDLQGRVIGFGGRSLGDDQPKYLNSPETELFDKGKTLYGLDKARATIAKQDQAIVVEGYFDVIALHAAGITNAVASLGTALSVNQVRQLLRYSESKRVVFNFDADRAGVQAAERAIGEVGSLAYQGEVQLRVLNLPNGKDPDEFLKSRTPQDYQLLVNNAPLWLDWQIQTTIAGRDLKQADQFQQSVMEIVALLGNLPNPSLRTHYVHYAAEQLSLGNSRMVPQIEENLRLQVRGQRWHGRSQKWQTPGDRNLLEECESQLLRIYLHSAKDRAAIADALAAQDLDFSLSHHRFLWRLCEELRQSQPAADLMEALRDRTHEFPREMSQVYALFELDEKTQRDILRSSLVIRTAIAGMERVMCDKRRRHFMDLWQTTDCIATPDLGQYYLQKMSAEVQRIRELDRQRQVNFADLAHVPLEFR